MSKNVSVFRSSNAKTEYYAAYEAMLKKWPVPCQELYIPTRFGDTHVIASGSQAAPPLVLLHSAGSGSVQWFRNVEPLSQHYRTYAIDVIGEVNKSITAQKLSYLRQSTATQSCVEFTLPCCY